MFKNKQGRIITFSLSFDKWKQYFWMEFDAMKGAGGTEETIPAIAELLHAAYDNSISPDDDNLIDDIFIIQLEAGAS